MDANDRNFGLNVKGDGVYLWIINDPSLPKVKRSEVLELIDSYGVSNVDYILINDILKSDDEEIDIKISSSTAVIQSSETASIDVSPDGMEAFITFVAPVNSDKTLTVDEIKQMLRQANVLIIDDKLIESVIANKKYERKMVVAKGINPTDSVDGFLQFHFDKSNLKPKPKIMADGTVNFKQLGLFRLCNRGDVLVTSVPAREGRPGRDVYGNELPPNKPKPAAVIPKGKGTVLSPDGNHLIADVSGQLVLTDGKINVSAHLELPGNVDNSTGDIEFNGQITIRGNIGTGFTVKAIGDIEVFGVCEGSTVISEEGNIVFGNGVQGADKAFLSAAGDITAKFIESSTVKAGGNITADSIMKSKISCDGSVILSGKNGFLVGGKLVAGDKLIATTIGSNMGTVTEIEVGGNPKQLLLQKELSDELDKLKLEYEKCDKAVTTLAAMKQRNQLTEDKKALLVKMINMKMVYRDKMSKIQAQLDKLIQDLSASSGTVAASNVIRSGARITIGNSQMIVRDDLSNCKLRNRDGRVTIGPNI